MTLFEKAGLTLVVTCLVFLPMASGERQTVLLIVFGISYAIFLFAGKKESKP